MRPLEIVIVTTVIAAVAWRMGGPRRHRLHRPLATAVIGVSVVQLAAEGFRWQLAAPYAAGILLAAVAWLPARPIRRPHLRLAGWTVAGLLAAGLPVMLPIPSLSPPDGPYAVGTTTIVAVDESRVEHFGPSPGGPRTLPIHIWYPASQTEETAPGWLSPEVSRAVADEFGLPGFFLDHLQLTVTHAVTDAPMATGTQRFPIVIYSHGWTGFGRISPDQPEQLASHGYVVLAPDHTYGALVADLPSGLVGFDEAALPDEDSVDEATYEMASARLVATYAADLAFVLDLLTVIEPAGLGMAERIDLERIGIFGHSTGGGAAVAVCHSDARCDAVLGLDPWVTPVDSMILGDGLTQPFLALRSDPWVGEENDEALFAMHDAGSNPSTIMALQGANHYDFVALSQISPLARYLGFKGPIPGPIAQASIRSVLLSFFDLHLRSTDTPVHPFEQLRLDAERS